jgi:SWI/SNF-related matrix-associated actin-dependent regulator 1 of chromatin subfamily A
VLTLLRGLNFRALSLSLSTPLTLPSPGVYDRERAAWLLPLAAHAAVERDVAPAAVAALPELVLRVLRAPAWTAAAGRVLADVPVAAAAAVLGPQVPLALLAQMKPYQRAGVVAAVERGGRVLLADEMGLGKTLQALVVALHYRAEWPLLVVCPSALRAMWAAECARWLGVAEGDIAVVLNGKMALAPLQPVTIVSYDLAARLLDVGAAALRAPPGVLIADESHYLKSGDADRTRGVRSLATKAARAIFISGTPALSRPIELFPQLQMLAPRLFSNLTAFGKRYCDGRQTPFGWQATGATHLDELHLVLSKTVLIRRLKRDCLTVGGPFVLGVCFFFFVVVFFFAFLLFCMC